MSFIQKMFDKSYHFFFLDSARLVSIEHFENKIKIFIWYEFIRASAHEVPHGIYHKLFCLISVQIAAAINVVLVPNIFNDSGDGGVIDIFMFVQRPRAGSETFIWLDLRHVLSLLTR